MKRNNKLYFYIATISMIIVSLAFYYNWKLFDQSKVNIFSTDWHVIKIKKLGIKITAPLKWNLYFTNDFNGDIEKVIPYISNEKTHIGFYSNGAPGFGYDPDDEIKINDTMIDGISSRKQTFIHFGDDIPYLILVSVPHPEYQTFEISVSGKLDDETIELVDKIIESIKFDL